MNKNLFLAAILAATAAATRLAWGQTNSCTPGHPKNGNLCLAESAVKYRMRLAGDFVRFFA